ncbi:glucose-1-phosphate cytidylyltransferase [Patescibacteria group bacterium]|nr:MAG: glucose-1-phosphate cytidylyltransferase [Patescibacteria group bacterium]
MKTIILCGGIGTRMKEETEFKPKPLVLVGGKPILWHIMKIYAHYGFNEFILALGYKGDMIKQYFLNWRSLANDFTLDTHNHEVTFHNNDCDHFKITFAETGPESLTGERVRRLRPYLDGDEEFMVTYGDGVGDINIQDLLNFHKNQNTLGTITGIKLTSRFGMLDIDHQTKKLRGFFQHKVTDYNEVRSGDSDYVNGGFMIFKKDIFDLLTENSMIESIFAPLARAGQLSIYAHQGKWKCMDTYKEVEDMNELWHKDPFWKVWHETKTNPLCRI